MQQLGYSDDDDDDKRQRWGEACFVEKVVLKTTKTTSKIKSINPTKKTIKEMLQTPSGCHAVSTSENPVTSTNPVNGHCQLLGSTPTHWNTPFSNQMCCPLSPSCVHYNVVSTEVSNNQPDTGKPFFIRVLKFLLPWDKIWQFTGQWLTLLQAKALQLRIKIILGDSEKCHAVDFLKVLCHWGQTSLAGVTWWHIMSSGQDGGANKLDTDHVYSL